MKYRSRTEILGQVLHCVSHGGSTKTKIMYKAYLSYAQMKEYIKLLQEKDLIKYEEGTQLFKITEKGIWFLHKYDEILEVVSENKYFADDTEYTSKSELLI